MATALARGFADPVFDSQRAFRDVMMALARPGTIQALACDLAPPPPLTAELAGVALALCDHETPVWLDPSLRAAPAVVEYLCFHTGAPMASTPDGAAFALVADAAACPRLAGFALGSDEYPDRSTTVVLAVDALSNRHGLVLRGPGIKNVAVLGAAPLPQDFEQQVAANRTFFPRGIDLVFVSTRGVAAMPRSTALIGRR